MNKPKRSNNAFDTTRIHGTWWIPGAGTGTVKLSGELIFNTATGGSLTLSGELSTTTEKISVIHGEGNGKECITIFNAYVDGVFFHRTHTGLVVTQTVRFFDMWSGPQLFERKEDIVFTEYVFGIHNVENWLDHRGFRTAPHAIRGNKASLLFTIPRPVLLFEDDRFSILLTSDRVGTTVSFGQLVSTIEHFPRIVIRSKKGQLPYYGKTDSFSEREGMIFTLISLLMGTATWPFGPEGYGFSDANQFSCFSSPTLFHCVQQDWREIIPAPTPSAPELLFPYKTIGKRFPTIAAHFSNVFRSNENAIAVLFQLQSGQKTLNATTLPELLFAFESLEKVLLDKKNKKLENKDKTKIDRIKNKLHPACTKKEWQLISNRLAPMGLSFSRRLRLVFWEVESIYPDLKDVGSPLVEYLNKSRNNYAHEAKSTSDDNSLYRFAASWVAELMTVMILLSCGLSAKKIHAILFRADGIASVNTKHFFNLFRQKMMCSKGAVPASSPASPLTKSKSPMTATCSGASLSLDTGKESMP